MHFNGLLRPAEGQVFIAGQELTYKAGELSQIRKRVGLLFQYPEHQLFEKTVFEDIAFVLKRNKDLPPQEIEEKVRMVCPLVGLDSQKFWSRSPWELSRGEMRRVALAGILVQDPQILILDEPMVGLDGSGKKEILREIGKLSKTGRTIIVISHEVEELLDIIDRLIVLEKGRVIITGPPNQVFSFLWQSQKLPFLVPPFWQLSYRLKKGGWFIPEEIWRTKEIMAYLASALKVGKIPPQEERAEN